MRIKLQIQNYRCFSGEPVEITIEPGFTAFVGPNNAGKSTILRFLFEFRGFFRSFMNNWTAPGPRLGVGVALADPTDIYPRGRPHSMNFAVEVPTQEVGEVCSMMVIYGPEGGLLSFRCWNADDPKPIDGRGWELSQLPKPTLHFSQGSANCQTLCEALRILGNTLYVGAFRNSLDLEGQSKHFDMSVGRSFVEMWHRLKSGPNREGNRIALAIERTMDSIFNTRGFQANSAPDDESIQLFLGDHSLTLGEVGSGLSHFLIVLTHAATLRPALLLIDEPEIGLHPSLQLDFLTSIGRYASFGTLFSTHSIGLARSAANSHMYAVNRTRQGHFVRPIQKSPRLGEFLGEMSYSGYTELGFNRILLVEGITDVPVFQVMLRKLRRDHRIVLITLGGSTMINGSSQTEIQLLELCRITGHRISAVIDSEKAAKDAELPPDRAAFEKLCARHKIDCHVLEKRATEHYWTESALREAGLTCQPLEPYQAFDNRWSKEQNWRMADAMTVEDLENTDLGQFLKNLQVEEVGKEDAQ